MKDSKFVCGIFLISLGALWLVSNMLHIRIFSMGSFWPLTVILVGVCFECIYFSTHKCIGFLVPGGILITIGILFIFEVITRWHFAAYTWPVYILSVAVGLFQLYYFGKRQWQLLIPVGILVTVAVISFTNMILGSIFRFFNYSLLIPGILIIVGIVFLVGGFTSKGKE